MSTTMKRKPAVAFPWQQWLRSQWYVTRISPVPFCVYATSETCSKAYSFLTTIGYYRFVCHSLTFGHNSFPSDNSPCVNYIWVWHKPQIHSLPSTPFPCLDQFSVSTSVLDLILLRITIANVLSIHSINMDYHFTYSVCQTVLNP